MYRPQAKVCLPASVLRRGQSTWPDNVAKTKTDKQNLHLMGKFCVYNDRWRCKTKHIPKTEIQLHTQANGEERKVCD